MFHRDNLEMLKKLATGKKVVLYGAGIQGTEAIVMHLKNIAPAYFCDGSPEKWGKFLMGVHIHPPEKLLDEDKENLLVILTTPAKEIEYTLRNLYGVKYIIDDIKNLGYIHASLYLKDAFARRFRELERNKDKVEMVYQYLSDDKSKYVLERMIDHLEKGAVYFSDICDPSPQYFNEIFENAHKEGVFIDGGCAGGTILKYLHYVNNPHVKAYGFEPDPILYWQECKYFKNAPDNIRIFDYALSDTEGVTSFFVTGAGHSLAQAGGSHEVKTITLDNFIKEKVSFIKLDIEGSESAALQGAAKLIANDKPNLAISVYHEDDDLYKLPLMIKP